MADSLNRVFTSGPSAWTSLARGQQLLLLALGLTLPVVLFVGSQWMADGQYVPLFASLTAEDAGAIVNQLRSAKTPYRVAGNGDQILVPADKVSELRLRMAVQGLPLGGGVGFEVFDKAALGVSDFTQRLNYQRALQGELARTIGQLREVARARVHLVMPPPSLFSDRDRPASASVFVKLAPGALLGSEQIRGIVHLVASSVEGLSPERVTLVDTGGRVLSMGGGGAGALSPQRLEMKTSLEEGIERRIQSLLDATLGPGHAVARVAAQVNFDQVERTEEKYDPTAVTRQKTRSVESTKGRSTTATAPTVAADATNPTTPPTPPAPSANNGAVTQNDGSRESESVTYELSRMVARTLTAPGEIRRLSVAVILSTASKVSQTGNKDAREPQPRAPEEIEKIRKVVMGAIGFNEQRGDQVTVVEMPFDTSALDRERALLEQPSASAPPPRSLLALPALTLPTIALALVAAVVAAGLVWLLVRGKSRQRELAAVALSLERQESITPSKAAELAPKPRLASLPRPPTSLIPEELMEMNREREDIRQRASALATAEPDASAQLLRAWLVKKKPSQIRGSHDGG